MTTLEMQILFETRLQTSNPLFKEQEKPDTFNIFLYLNKAQEKFINDKYLSSPGYLERSIQISAFYEEIGELVKFVDLTFQSVGPYSSTELYLPANNVLHFISVSGKITRTYPNNITEVLTDFNRIEGYKLNEFLTTDINKPILLVPVYVTNYNATNENNVLVIFDKYVSAHTDLVTQCLVAPDKLVLNSPGSGESTECQLAEKVHEDVVDLAVSLYEADKYKLLSKDSND